ncbi:MAG: transketolase family protein [Candidatus Omnitrophica bacterium]|nr:transketolase family protein [Candidatus Omnitrophota bacterium]
MAEEIKKGSTRDGFGKALVALGDTNKNVVVLSADLTESVRAHWFRDKYPDRFVSHGVAEQDMMGAAAGMALSGKIPFATTFGAFASGRAWDQVRISIAYMGLNVNIAGSHGGISVGEDGATHQALEEIALMRILPGMTVVVPGDYDEAFKATIQAVDIDGPVYLRLGRLNVPFLNAKEEFVIGKARTMTEGTDIAIVASGHMVYKAIEASEILKGNGISAEVINLHTPKPLDEETLLRAAKKTKAVLTVEEHSIYGGMGSAVAEFLVENYPVPMKLMGIREEFGVSGSPDELYEYFNLTKKDIALEAEKLIGRKTT